MVTLRLSGRAETKEIKHTEELFAKVKGDSSESLDDYLDGVYRKRFPNPIHDEPYNKTPARTDRAVLAEIFTGSGCPPCVAADLVFDSALERYSRRDVVVLMYHQHIPRPDPMTNPATLARAKFYKVNGVPSYAIDGKLASGGGPRSYAEEMWNKVNPDLEKRLELAPNGKVQVDASLDGSSVRVKATADAIKTESKEVTLQVALVEETLRYSGENGIRFHPMVVRGLGGPEEAGFKFDPAKPAPVEVTFDLTKIGEALTKHLDDYEKDKKITFSEKKAQIDRAKLGIVAFVQDEKSKEILQSIYVKLEPHGTSD
jgi:thiol-disulfide isomerase/thioredoxin